MRSLQQVMERARERDGFPPRGVVSVRQILSHFSLTPALSVRALLASDLIGERYELDGRSAGPVGIPMGNVRLTADGAVQPFSGGFIALRNKKVDPVVTFQAAVRFLGFRCDEESDHDQLTPSDEPYFIIGITGLKSNTTRLFGPFEDVDGGESRFTSVDETFLVTDAQPPFVISVVAKEHDEGEPEEAAAKVKSVCEDAINITQGVAATLGQAQVVAVTIMLDTLFNSIGGVVSGAAAAVLGLGDDFIGSRNESIGDWNDGEEEWKTRPRLIEEPTFSESPYNLKIPVGDGGEGKYTLYFNVNIRRITTEPV
jgi:hypothetical protein